MKIEKINRRALIQEDQIKAFKYLNQTRWGQMARIGALRAGAKLFVQRIQSKRYKKDLENLVIMNPQELK